MDDKTAEEVLTLLAGLESVSAARITTEGTLVRAQGFLSGLLPAGDVSRQFRAPSWAQLSGKSAGEATLPVYRGPITLTGERGGEHVLDASVWRTSAGLVVLAERQADDLERMSKSAVRLSNELAAARLELASRSRDLGEREERIRVMTFVDRITGLGNQRSFNQALAAEVLRAVRYGGPLCLVLASIDGLEGLAEQVGDERAHDVLRCFARAVCNETRKTDHACRAGGNRFMLLLTHTPPDRAAGITDRIRVAFAAASPGMAAATVTASFGHAAWREGDDAGALTERVERALGSAIAAGGDRVETA